MGTVERMRVVTQNLWARYGPWDDRRRVLVEGLRELRPDVVAFQEAIVYGGYDQVMDLLGPDYHVWHQKERESDGSGSSIASRWPLGEVREVDLHVTERTADFCCVAIVADIRWPVADEPLVFVNHKPSWKSGLEYERERQAVATATFVEELVAGRDRHVVVVGDFDAMPDAASLRFWRGNQSLDGTSVHYRDAWECTHREEPGETFAPSLNPLVESDKWPSDIDRRIDYIFVRCTDHGTSLPVEHSERIFDKPVGGAWASDHFGVMADFVLPSQ
jgi:endonuclease/exonuclease/phosphatase family metal-dependent hydrolase